MMNKTIQEKWNQECVVGYDCIVYGDGRIVMANTYSVILTETSERKRFWFPLCDTSLEGLQKYEEDIWTQMDIYHGSFTHKGQTIVFGDGAMGNEGYVASLNANKELNWSIFFTFSNPICRAKILDNYLICYGDTGTVIKINWDNLTDIEISHQEQISLQDIDGKFVASIQIESRTEDLITGRITHEQFTDQQKSDFKHFEDLVNDNVLSLIDEAMENIEKHGFKIRGQADEIHDIQIFEKDSISLRIGKQ